MLHQPCWTAKKRNSTPHMTEIFSVQGCGGCGSSVPSEGTPVWASRAVRHAFDPTEHTLLGSSRAFAYDSSCRLGGWWLMSLWSGGEGRTTGVGSAHSRRCHKPVAVPSDPIFPGCLPKILRQLSSSGDRPCSAATQYPGHHTDTPGTVCRSLVCRYLLFGIFICF